MEGQTIEFRGLTNELLHCNDDGTIKSTEIYNMNGKNPEILSITITSVNLEGEHQIFDMLLNKELEISVRSKKRKTNT